MASPARSGADSTESGDPQQPCKTSATEFFERSSLTRFSPARKCSTPLPRPCEMQQSLPDGFAITPISEQVFMELRAGHMLDASEGRLRRPTPARDPGYVLSNSS
jgi:hypothetical protein